MLDALMGRNRNATGPVQKLSWESREVCPYYISYFCPHDLFTNTKADLGSCASIHDDDLRKSYEEAEDSSKKQAAADDFLRICQRMLGDLSGKIKRSKERLEMDQIERMAAFGITPQQLEENEEKVTILTEKINGLVDQAEQAGNQGDVEEAQGLLKLCDQLKLERDDLKAAMTGYKMAPGPDGFGPPKEREVCETCGAFLVKGDSQTSMNDHLMGKLHVGYARIRASVDSIVEERRQEREVKDKLREERNKAAEEEKAQGKEENKGKDLKDLSSKDRDRKRSRSRDRKKRSRSRDRRRSRERRRSSSRDKRDQRRDHEDHRRGDHEDHRRGDHEDHRRGEHKDHRRGDHKDHRRGDHDHKRDNRRDRSRDRERRRSTSRDRKEKRDSKERD